MKRPKIGADDFAAAGLGEADLEDLPRADLGPTLDRHGDEFTFDWPQHRIACLLQAVHEARDGVHAELTVCHGGTQIHWGRLALASTSAREGLVRKLLSVVPKAPWRHVLETACARTVEALRTSTVTVPLVPRPAPAEPYLVEPILRNGETVTEFGDGGGGKGWLALLLALAACNGAPVISGIRGVRRVPVLWCDWEAEQTDMEDRLYRLSRGTGLGTDGIYYRRMHRPLADEVAPLRAEVSRLGAGLIVIDSLAPASGPEPEGADAAVRTFSALRTLSPQAARLVIAHVSKFAAEQRGATRPFGSVFVANLARATWEVRRSDDGEDDLLLALYHRKSNNSRLHPPLSLRFTFGPEAVTVHHADLAQAPDLLDRTPLPFRLRTALAAGARTSADLAEELAVPKATVDRTLARLAAKGRVIKLSTTKPFTWGLPTR